MSDLQRIKKVINWLIFSEFASSDKELANIMGYNKSYFSQILNGKVPLSDDFINKLIAIDKNINKVWVTTGKEEMLKNTKKTDEQDNILPAYQCLNENTNQGIPLIPSSAMAGFFTGDIQVLEYECERFIIPSFKDADFLISVKGSSMEPKYSSGDLVACKRMSIDTFFQWNKVYVLDTEQGPLIKRVNEGKNENTLLICSENPKYPPFQLNRSLIHNIALVVGVIRLE